jgi:hypothetical protein
VQRRGALAAREAQDPVALAWITVQQAYLLCRLGRPAEARRSLLTVMDAGRSHDLPVLNGWARLIEGMVLTDEGKLEQAERVFSEATEILTAKGSARDLAYLYLEHGLLALKRGEQEQAYLNFEEGLHISEKLQLSYLKCRYFFATAALEATIGGVEASRAEKNLVFAESVAGQAPYPEILWQVRYQLGKLFLATKRYHEAEVRFRHATSGISAILRKMSPAHAQSYRRATGAKDIENMIDGCKFAAIPSVMLKGNEVAGRPPRPLYPPSVRPPSQTIVWPVMKAASSLARKACSAAMSSGAPNLPSGMRAANFSSTLGGTRATMSVWMIPGATQFTVIPSRASSSASVRVKPITPAFDAE